MIIPLRILRIIDIENRRMWNEMALEWPFSWPMRECLLRGIFISQFKD
jgi:hypothetical protein